MITLLRSFMETKSQKHLGPYSISCCLHDYDVMMIAVICFAKFRDTHHLVKHDTKGSHKLLQTLRDVIKLDSNCKLSLDDNVMYVIYPRKVYDFIQLKIILKTETVLIILPNQETAQE